MEEESAFGLCSLLRAPYPGNDSLPLRLSNSAPAFGHDNRPNSAALAAGTFQIIGRVSRLPRMFAQAELSLLL
jgi:hypothetical protein